MSQAVQDPAVMTDFLWVVSKLATLTAAEVTVEVAVEVTVESMHVLCLQHAESSFEGSCKEES